MIEEIQVMGSDLVERVKQLIREGNVRRLIIRNQNDDVILEIPLNTGVAVGGVLTIFAPAFVPWEQWPQCWSMSRYRLFELKTGIGNNPFRVNTSGLRALLHPIITCNEC